MGVGHRSRWFVVPGYVMRSSLAMTGSSRLQLDPITRIVVCTQWVPRVWRFSAAIRATHLLPVSVVERQFEHGSGAGQHDLECSLSTSVNPSLSPGTTSSWRPVIALASCVSPCPLLCLLLLVSLTMALSTSPGDSVLIARRGDVASAWVYYYIAGVRSTSPRSIWKVVQASYAQY
ncbi:hypothetical protein OH76DRAFT_6822 [Lentinus brumalis]|uniref:Uncharacterized protein n=1 Tax=Lentinus brumalis TaxID=2498619 RepID=A0A371DWS7_9APHY|nr:hypothetical protein OH76DRAFT_6822 [Polyporus brumalis]